MKFKVEMRELPAIAGFMSRKGKTVFVVVDDCGNESWECATEESASLRCAALNYDEANGGRCAESMIEDFLSA